MSFDKEKLTSSDLARVRKGATATLFVSIGVMLGWLFAYNIIAHEMNPVLAFFKILDGINELVVGMLTVIVIGIGIVVVYIDQLFTQTMTNLYSMRILEDLIREHSLTGEMRTFVFKIVF